MLNLLNKKTEYGILIINDSNNININDNQNLSKSNVELTTESNLIFENEKKYKKNRDDEKYKNFHYFNRFHSSVTSDRKEPNYLKKKFNLI